MNEAIKKIDAVFSDVCKQTGLSEEELRNQMDFMNEKGITSEDFIIHKCWELKGKPNVLEIIRLREQYAKTLQTKLGIERIEALEQLEIGRKCGLSGKTYLRYDGFLLNKLQLADLAKAIRAWKANAWDVSQDELVKKLKFGWECGISTDSFLKYNGYMLNDHELHDLADTLNAWNEKQKKTREWYINVVQERTGWTKDESKERMEIARSKGYTYRNFIKEALYKLPTDSFKELKPYVKKQNTPIDREAIKNARELKESYRSTMKEEMGWNDAQLDLAYLKSKTVSGASFSEFFLFGLYKLPVEEGKKYMTMETHLKMQLRYIDFKGTQEYFENKTLFNTHFSEFVKRRWFNNDQLTFEEFERQIEGLNKIIYKPMEGIEGIGIEVYDVNCNKEQNLHIYNLIMQNGPANIEEFLVQNSELSEFWPNSVNTIRMMTIYKEGKGHVLNAVIKFGTKANVDNYYQGGIAAGIDINTGKICTDGVNNKGVLFETHPYSNKKFKGFKIPNWEKIVATCEAASSKVKEMPYVGWDIAINHLGEPEIIEGNHNQGAYLIQYSFAVSNKEGRRYTIDPYLWFDEK